MVQENIVSPRLTHEGFSEPDVKAGTEALVPAVRYSALVLRNATSTPGLVHARVEVDAFHTTSKAEIGEALDRWELMRMNEELRGLPKREYPHRPGAFQFGSADECPKPGVAGIALMPRTRWLDSWQGEDREWEETLWRFPRNRAPVDVEVVFPPLRNAVEQEMLEDRRAANLDKLHRGLYGKAGGHLRRLREQRESRKIEVATADEWLAQGPNMTEYEKQVNESAALGLLPPPPPVNNASVGKGLDDSDEWVDIRTVDFAAVYSEEYGEEWKKNFPLDPAEWEELDDENARRVLSLREFYKRERDGSVARLDDADIVSSLVLSNASSGLRLGDNQTLQDSWNPVDLDGKWSAAPGVDDAVGDAGGINVEGRRRGGNADAWAAEEEALETLRDEVEAAVQLGLTPAELRLYQEWKKAGSPDPAEWKKTMEEQGGTKVEDLGGGALGAPRGPRGANADGRQSSPQPDGVFFSGAVGEAFEELLREELVLLQEGLAAAEEGEEEGEEEEGAASQVAEPGWNISGVANFSLDDATSGGADGGVDAGGAVAAGGSELGVPMIDERSLAGLTYTPGSDLSERLGDAFRPLEEDDDQARGWGGGQNGLSRGQQAGKAAFRDRLLERLPQLGPSMRQREFVMQRIDTFLDDDGLRFVRDLPQTRGGVQALLEALQAVDMDRLLRAQGESEALEPQRQDAASNGEEEERSDYVIFDAGELGLVFTDAGSKFMIPDGESKGGQVENVTPSPKLSMEAWQYDIIFRSRGLKNRVREALIRLLLVEEGAAPEDRSGPATGPFKDADVSAGVDAQGGENSNRSADGAKVQAEDGAVGAEVQTVGEASAKVSAVWQRALDQVLLDLEELVALDAEEMDEAAAAGAAPVLPIGQVLQGNTSAKAGSEGEGAGPADREQEGESMPTQYLLQRPHCVATLMVMLAQPKTRAAGRLLEKLSKTEDSQTIDDCYECLDELLYSEAVPGNVMGVELLWTAEAEAGFEREDILSFRRLERLYPELWPDRLRAEEEAREAQMRELEAEEQRKKDAYTTLLNSVKDSARLALGNSTLSA